MLTAAEADALFLGEPLLGLVEERLHLRLRDDGERAAALRWVGVVVVFIGEFRRLQVR
jgi:hypothetical protein